MFEHYYLLLSLACGFGLFMAWGVGANDVANAMGTSVGSKALSLKQAVIIAAIFESAGAILAGGEVTATIRGEIIDASLFTSTPEILVYGMIASLLAAGVWLLVASRFGWPVSTTHSIVGAIIGFALIQLGPSSIHWHKVVAIVSSWIFSPFIACIIAFSLFKSIQYLILNTKNPVKNAKRYLPFYIFIVAFVVSLVTIDHGLAHVGLAFGTGISTLIAAIIAMLLSLISKLLLSRLSITPSATPQFDYMNVEKLFALLMIFTACSMAFSHGSNDVANAIGPLAAVIDIIQQGQLNPHAALPVWILLLGAVGIVAGLAMYGYKVIETIGQGITELTPSRGFAAELATASTVIIASGIGLPISTTQTLVGAILGVGFARGIGALNIKVIRNIFMSWVITLPAGALLAVIFYYIIAMGFNAL